MSDMEKTKAERLNKVVNTMLGLPDGMIANDQEYPFDISRPVKHASKKAFKTEFAAVDKIVKRLEGLLDAFLAEGEGEDGFKIRAPLWPLEKGINQKAIKITEKWITKTARQLAFKNIVSTSFQHNALISQFLLLMAYTSLRRELHLQKASYWSGRGRSRNHYAYIIADRMARLYVCMKLARPGVGESSDGNHPSTDYARAVEEAFEILGISAHWKAPALEARDGITDSDIRNEYEHMSIPARYGIGGHPRYKI